MKRPAFALALALALTALALTAQATAEGGSTYAVVRIYQNGLLVQATNTECVPQSEVAEVEHGFRVTFPEAEFTWHSCRRIATPDPNPAPATPPKATEPDGSVDELPSQETGDSPQTGLSSKDGEPSSWSCTLEKYTRVEQSGTVTYEQTTVKVDGCEPAPPSDSGTTYDPYTECHSDYSRRILNLPEYEVLC